MERRKRGAFAVVALAAALFVLAPGAAALPEDGAGVAGDVWAWVVGWWAEVFGSSEVLPHIDPNGAEVTPRLDPDGAEVWPNLDPDGAEVTPNLDPDG